MTLNTQTAMLFWNCQRWAAVFLVACSTHATDSPDGTASGRRDAPLELDAAEARDAGFGVNDDGEYCARLNEPACRADALCRPVQASIFDAQFSCRAPRYAGCYRRDAGCTAALVSARDAEDRCWLFVDGCLPPGYEAINSQDPACGYATFDSAPECGQ